MIQYPLTNISKEQWNKKVNTTYMYSIPLEDDALPILEQVVDILQNLHSKNLQQVIAEQYVQYFFTQVFPIICQKILKSRYFKNPKVLNLANKTLQYSVNLVIKYIEYAQKWPIFAQTLITVFNSQQYYYKTNNQMLDSKSFAVNYLKQTNRSWTEQLKEDDYVDILKFTHNTGKATWSRGKILIAKTNKLKIQYEGDYYDETVTVDRNSYMIAPYKSKSQLFDWRLNLKSGDRIDCQDHYGGWYGATVLQIIQKKQNKKMAKITFKVYDQKGNKQDEFGKFYGLTDYYEQIDITSPKIQPFSSIVKQKGYFDSGIKSLYDNDDLNDEQFEQICEQKFYALPRKRCLSQFVFNLINSFGKLGGFNIPLDRLQASDNISFLCYYVKGISGISGSLTRNLVKSLIQRLKILIQKYIFSDSELFIKQFTKQRSQMLFSGFKTLQKRIYSIEAVYQYQNQKKMKIVDRCIQSQSLKRKLQGLNQLKDIVRSLTMSSQRNKSIKNWIKQQKLFQKVYLYNSHVQLIKKSQDFFRYLINQSILQVHDLERLYKIAQKGDYQSRVSLYKLFQQVSHVFKKPHVDFLIDTILQSDLSLILNQDIDLLNEMSKFSNYFPKDKVRAFFQNIILGDNQHENLYQHATKKYSQMVAKGYQMKSCRKDIIHSFLTKLSTHHITQVIKVLKGIFEGIGIGQYGKKQLNQILAQQNIDQVIISAIKNTRGIPKQDSVISEVLQLLSFIYKLSYKVKILIKTLKSIWYQMNHVAQKRRQYFKWVNQLIGCQQGLGDSEELDQFQSFFKQLFPKQNLKNIKLQEFHLIKNLILQINKKNKFIQNVPMSKQNQVRRKVDMNQLRLSEYFMYIIYQSTDRQIYGRALDFFLQILNAKQNDIDDINAIFQTILSNFYLYKQQKAYVQLQKTLLIIGILIDNSQKKHDLAIQSLVTKQQKNTIHLTIVNEYSYASDFSKKKQVLIPINATLFQLKKALTKQFNYEVQEIKLSQDRQIPDYYNSRTIKQLPIIISDPITISRRYTTSYYQPEMTINNRLNPKAVRCFRVIFQRYSSNGKMSKQQAHQFTAACLVTSNRRHDDKVNDLFKEYDYDKDDYLQVDGFLAFYQNASKTNKGTTVWQNLKSFGVNTEFKFSNQVNKPFNINAFPRKRLSEDQNFYESLFELLQIEDLAEISFNLLQRLPVYKKIYNEVLGIGVEGVLSQQKIKNVFIQNQLYKYYYNLKVVSSMGETVIQKQRQWLLQFTHYKGIEYIYQNFKNMVQICNIKSKIVFQIISYNIKIMFQYFVLCFIDQYKANALALLNYDIQILQKVQYLIIGILPKSSKSQFKPIQIDKEMMQEWKGQNKQLLLKTFIKFLSNIWKNWAQKLQKYPLRQSIIQSTISIILLLQINQYPTQLIYKLQYFLQNSPSNKLLKQFYSLILINCFYSTVGQNMFISQMFKHITLNNITSDYFGVLAVLVQKFGMEEERLQELPQILLKNILNQKNQLTIQGCAKLLANFHLKKQVAQKQVSLLWDNLLFGRNSPCKKQQTRQAIYQLILKVCQSNKQVTDLVIKKTVNTIQNKFKSIKITYSTEVNQRSPTGYAGLKNLGNICYMNSMLQQLYMNKTFRYLLMRIDDGKPPQWALDSKDKMVDDNFLHQLQRIFGYLQKTTRLDFVPSAFCVAYKPFGESVNIMIQQDVQEFVSMFFDRLQNGIKDHPLRRLIDNFYSGKYANLFNCHQCKQTKQVVQTFYSLSLEVKNSKTLAQSFNKFILGQLINDYKCDFCQKKADVSKKTRISKSPQMLILHLQRIDMNFETFVNQKLTNKHEFPHKFNIYPYTLDYYNRQQANEPNLSKQHPNYQYQLSGITCHIGNAQMGHYISYIKNQQGKWLQFNDSLVNNFNPDNIESQCFGGSFTYDDEYDWQKRQNSKSAYLLIYQRIGPNNIELQVKSVQQKHEILKTLRLTQDIILNQQKKQQQPTQSQQQSSQPVQDSQKQKQKQFMIQMEQIQMIKKHKSQDNIIIAQKSNEGQREGDNIIIKIKQKIQPYISKQLQDQIQVDNQIHFFQKCLAAPSFSKFFAKLLLLPQHNLKEMVKLCQKMTFGFWLKSTSFKQLLNSLSFYIKQYPSGLIQIISQNTNLINLLIQNIDQQIRTNMALFLANSFSYFINQKQISLKHDDMNQDNQMILAFLDNLFSLIPTTVSKCWTKFNQYFQFWYQFSKKLQVNARYMVQKQFIKHFIDYFLDKKSPLKIYINRPTIGSSYASPNFTMLLKTVESLLQFYIKQSISLTHQQKLILLSFSFIQKLIQDNHQSIAAKITRVICPNSLHASQKIAIVLLRGFNKSNYENVQKYLQVLHQYISIDDQYRHLRVLWTLGKQTILVYSMSKTLSVMNSYNLDDRIYDFSSALGIESGSSLLQHIFVNSKRTQNCCMIMLQQLMKLCAEIDNVRQYVWSLGPPNFLFGKYVDFFQQFINKYIDQSRKHGYSISTSFSKQQLGKNVKRLYQQCVKKMNSNIENVGQHQQNSQVKVEQKIVIEPEQEQFLQPKNVDQQKMVQQKQIYYDADAASDEAQSDHSDNRNDFENNDYPTLNQGLQDKLNLRDVKTSDIYNFTYVVHEPQNQNDYQQQIMPQVGKQNQISTPVKKRQINFQDSQQQNLIQKQVQKQYKEDKYDDQNGNKKSYHPVKLIYKVVDQINSQMQNVKIQKHQSELVLVRTYPTGISNKSFTSTYSHKKVCQRIDQKVWEDSKTIKIGGYFVSNNNKYTIRLKTEDGSVAIRCHETGWVWSQQILRIWIPDRMADWPQWSLYSQDDKKGKQGIMEDENIDKGYIKQIQDDFM